MEITDEIRKIASDLLERYKTAITDAGKTASGQLERTASYRVNISGAYLEVYFNLEDYWRYVENGTRPHFPPMDAIERWIQVKRIIPRTNGGKQIPTTRQLAYLISREISVKGTKPTKILQKTIDGADDLIEQLIEAITKQLQEEINDEIDNTTQK
jgi:hypothetical protein